MTKEEYNIAKIAFSAAIAFTDIDTDATQKSFVEWIKDNHNIIVDRDAFFHIMNQRSYEEYTAYRL